MRRCLKKVKQVYLVIVSLRWALREFKYEFFDLLFYGCYVEIEQRASTELVKELILIVVKSNNSVGAKSQYL